MNQIYCVPLQRLADEFDMQPVYLATDYEKINVTVEDVSRPGLQMTGFFDHFEPMRLQVIGTGETSYLHKLTPEERYAIFDRFFAYRMPALIAVQ